MAKGVQHIIDDGSRKLTKTLTTPVSLNPPNDINIYALCVRWLIFWRIENATILQHFDAKIYSCTFTTERERENDG